LARHLPKNLLKPDIILLFQIQRRAESLQSFVAQFGMLAEAGNSEDAAKVGVSLKVATGFHPSWPFFSAYIGHWISLESGHPAHFKQF
jgi:hypothetical protein